MNTVDNKDYKIGMLRFINEMHEFVEVKDIVVKIINEHDVEIAIMVAEDKLKIPVLMKLERKMYLSRNSRIKAIKAIDKGLSVLDIKNNTYRIEIICK